MKTILEYLQKGHIINNDYDDYIDLGLPSGTLWATMNIGATPGNKPEDWYGNYYAWGETEIKSDYSWKTYKYCNGTNLSLTKYNAKSSYGNVDNKTKLKEIDDAAYQYTDGEYKIPAKAEFEELFTYTNHKWIKDYNDINGLNGMLFTSKTDETKSIFIPAAGKINGSDINKTSVDSEVWCSERGFYPDTASGFYCCANGCNIFSSNRADGFTIRAILNK